MTVVSLRRGLDTRTIQRRNLILLTEDLCRVVHCCSSFVWWLVANLSFFQSRKPKVKTEFGDGGGEGETEGGDDGFGFGDDENGSAVRTHIRQ